MSSKPKYEDLEDIKSETDQQVRPLVKGENSFYKYKDITEIKQTEHELRKERDFTSAVLSTTGALVVVLDRRGRIVRFNRACEKLTGYLFEEVEGEHFWDLFLLRNER